MLPSMFAPAAKTRPFTFTVRLDEGFYDGMELDCASETTAIKAAQEILQARIDSRPPQAGPARRGLVGVGMGSMIAGPGDVIWLGEWEWTREDGWYWQSSD